MIKFERGYDRFDAPCWTAKLYTSVQDDDGLVLGTIRKGEWELPKRVRYEIFLGDSERPGAYAQYVDTLSEAKHKILQHVRELLTDSSKKHRNT